MEHIIQLHFEKWPEGIYLATSDDVQGLVAQGRTIQKTIEIARRRPEAAGIASRHQTPRVTESFDYPVIVAN